MQFQVAEMLRVSKKQLLYAELISNYPQKAGKKDFSLNNPLDLFYRNVSHLSYQDGLLLISSLINKDDRIISFWNWDEFIKDRKAELEILTTEFEKSGLKNVRDQVIAHQDRSNENNRFIDSRTRGVRPEIIKKTQEFLEKLIVEFILYTATKGETYNDVYFNTVDAQEEIETIMSLAKPELTNNFII